VEFVYVAIRTWDIDVMCYTQYDLLFQQQLEFLSSLDTNWHVSAAAAPASEPGQTTSKPPILY